MSLQRVKIFRRAVARYSLHTALFLFTRLPFSMVGPAARFFVNFAALFLAKQKRVARESLAIAFGQDKSPAEREEILRRCFNNFGFTIAETIYAMAHPEIIDRSVVIEGRTHVDEALAHGHGAVMVSAHFGNFFLMLLWFARHGYKTHILIRHARDEKVDEFLNQERKKHGLETIYTKPRRQCVSQVMKALRRNELVFVLLDQNYGTGTGVHVDFFGKPAATATGPIMFAQRTGARILPAFVVREGDFQHRIFVEPSFPVDERGDDDETAFVNVSRITGIIESYIRRYPHEWGWMHKRWKTRPKDDEKLKV